MVGIGSGGVWRDEDEILNRLPLAKGRQYQQLYYFMQRNIMTGETVKLKKAGASRKIAGRLRIK